MTDIPQQAITAAVAAYAREAYVDGEPIEGDERVIRAALEDAAPILAEHVAQKILAHRDAHEPKDGPTRRRWRRYLGIAARVASLAFSTEDDIKREAAQAIANGNFAGCFTREDDKRG